MQLSEDQINSIIDLALAEDISHGDVTSEVLMPPELQGKASILVKAEGIVAGGEVAKRVFLRVDPLLKVEVLIEDGTKIKRGDIVATKATAMSIESLDNRPITFIRDDLLSLL